MDSFVPLIYPGNSRVEPEILGITRTETLGRSSLQLKSDNNKRWIDHNKRVFLYDFEYIRLGLEVFDNINRLKTLCAITLSDGYCIS